LAVAWQHGGLKLSGERLKRKKLHSRGGGGGKEQQSATVRQYLIRLQQRNALHSLTQSPTTAPSSKLANISASLGINPSSSELASADLFISSTLTLSYISFAFDFVGLLLGLTLFFPKVNLFHIITHFIGGVYISWFIGDEWKYETLMAIVLTTNVSSMVVEIFMLIAIFGIKIIVY
jgi:hypothetical protein